MKRNLLVLLLLVIGIIPACKKDNQQKTSSGILQGTYQLTGIYYGSDVGSSWNAPFMDVTSEKTITVKADGTITCNGDLCYAETSTGTPTSGTYTNGILAVTNCNEMQYKAYGNMFIIGHGCMGVCKSRFLRIN
jgi:hypothetical protein